MSRTWEVTGVHGRPTHLRLADGHGPHLPAPEERMGYTLMEKRIARLRKRVARLEEQK